MNARFPPIADIRLMSAFDPLRTFRLSATHIGSKYLLRTPF